MILGVFDINEPSKKKEDIIGNKIIEISDEENTKADN